MAQTQILSHSSANWTATVAVPASQPGALAGFEAKCLTCGAVYGSSMASSLKLDQMGHDRFMVKMGK